MRYIVALVVVAASLAASAQMPAFEVVSVKEAPPPTDGSFRFGLGPQPGAMAGSARS